MKEVKAFILAELLIAIIKIIGGLVCNSYTILTSSIYDIVLIIISLILVKHQDNTKSKGIISMILGFIIIILGLGIGFLGIVADVKKISWFILLFIILSLLIRYIISCFYTNINYQKKKGLLSYGNINSNLDFYNVGVIIGVLVLSKLSKWVDIFKYADKLGTMLIVLLIVYKGIKVIFSSVKYLEDKIEVTYDDEKNEILKRDEVKKIDKFEVTSFGGVKSLRCEIQLKDGISMIDVNNFIVTLQDYLLKSADVVSIVLSDPNKKRIKPKVRSLKQDARNSRSGNSKTNVKKKNPTKKNKKR